MAKNMRHRKDLVFDFLNVCFLQNIMDSLNHTFKSLKILYIFILAISFRLLSPYFHQYIKRNKKNLKKESFWEQQLERPLV